MLIVDYWHNVRKKHAESDCPALLLAPWAEQFSPKLVGIVAINLTTDGGESS